MSYFSEKDLERICRKTVGKISPSKPGDTILDILKERNTSIEEFAEKVGWSLKRTKSIIKAEIEIDLGIASTLSGYFGVSVDFWLNREKKYRDRLKQIDLSKNRTTKFI